MARRLNRIICLCLLAAAVSVPVSADVVNVFANKDNTLYESPSGSLSNGAGESIFAGRTLQFQDSLRRALLAFDVAGAVPAGSTIVSATLRLYCIQSVSGDQTMTLHRTLQNWGESTSSADGMGGGGGGAFAMPGDATWLHTFSPGSFWANVGGDFDAAASASALVGGGGAIYQWTSPQMALDVQSWLDNPAANFGWTLLGNETFDGSAKRFASRETTNIFAIKPTLVVEYIPEPATVCHLVLGLVVVARRRRAL